MSLKTCLAAGLAVLIMATGVAPVEAGLFGRDKKKEREEETSAQAVEALARAEAFLAENAERDGVTVTESGLQYVVVEKGPPGGRAPFKADIVTVHYQGELIDGTQFDSSYARNSPYRTYVFEVIPGWSEGLQLMSEGDKYLFIIPPELAYGEDGLGDRIGPNEALVFQVEMIEVIRTGLAQ